MTVGEHTVGIVSPTGVSAGRNLITNPSLETALTGWTAQRGTITRAAIPRPVAGAWGGQFVSTVETVNQGNYNAFALTPAASSGPYTAAAFVEPFGAAADKVRFRVWINWYDAANAQVGPAQYGPASPLPAGEMTRLAHTSTRPSGATQVRMFVQAVEPIPVGAGFYWDAASIEAAAEAGPYFDGSTPNTALYHYGWTGTAHGSASIRNRYFAADLSCLVDEVSIAHGRDDSETQPDASAATVNLTASPEYPLPAEVEIGALLAVETAIEAGTSARFYGRITDLVLGWDDAGAATPDAGVGQIVAVGILGDLGRRVVGATPWPIELDGARVARVMSAAGITLDPLTSDPGTVRLLARDVDSQPALDVARSAAVSAGGVVWETRDGLVRYADADHRRNTPVGISLDACDVLVTPSWRRTIEGLINEVSIGYGLAPEGGEQPRYVATSAASVSRWGRYGYTSTTELAEAADAAAMGSLLLTRNADPVWVMAALPVDVEGLDAGRYAALLGLDMHSLVTLTGLPSLGTAPTSTTLWVEGWRETLTYGGHEVDLVVSGYCRTAPPPTWDEVNPSWAWDALDPALTWDGAACLGPPSNFGRWDDQPANLRWDQVGSATTWDNYR